LLPTIAEKPTAHFTHLFFLPTHKPIAKKLKE